MWESVFAAITATVVTTRFGRGRQDPTVRAAVSRASASVGSMQIGSHLQPRIVEVASTEATIIATGFTTTTATIADVIGTNVESSSQVSIMVGSGCACSGERDSFLRSTYQASSAAPGPRIGSGLASQKAAVFSIGLIRTTATGQLKSVGLA